MNVDAGGDQIRAHAERLLSEVKEENLAEVNIRYRYIYML